MNHPALEPRDKTLVQILVSNGKASEDSLLKDCEVLGRTRGMGVHLSLAEVLADLGTIDPATFQQASQLAAKSRVFLVDRSSLRHLAVQPDEDAQIARIATGYDLLRPEELAQATAVARELAGLGLKVLAAKVLADRQLLDCEIAEGILLLERRRRGAAAPGQAAPAAPPFDDEDLVFGSVAIRAGRLTKVQVERGIKFKIRLRKAGIEKKLPQIFFEQGVLDRAALAPLLSAMQGRLVPPRPVTYELLRLEAEDHAALDRLLQQGTLASPGALPKALDVQKKLSEMAIERPLVQILVDLGLADRKAIEAAVTQRTSPQHVLLSPASPSLPPPLPGATLPAATFPAPAGPAAAKRASGVRGGRGTGYGSRGGREPSGTTRSARGAGSGGAGMVIVGAVA
ncbi:MAG: hypothetical protein HY720_08865, partial [Planctomycetes bacterium]|nr:hypothetical protein [Planctomycetota bacterium]